MFRERAAGPRRDNGGEQHEDGGIATEVVPKSATKRRLKRPRLYQVILNLLTNALRHTPSDGSVAVRVEQVDQEVQVSVEDTGEGLGDEACSRMFDRFWRGDPARSARGAGLGLAIARGLVEAHGGRIWAEDRPGGGARVSFTLPAGP